MRPETALGNPPPSLDFRGNPGEPEASTPSLTFFPLHAIPLQEFLHPAFSVNDLPLARVEWMARRADFHSDLGLDGTRGDRIAARADDVRVHVFRMYALFHILTYRKVLSAHSKSALKRANRFAACASRGLYHAASQTGKSRIEGISYLIPSRSSAVTTETRKSTIGRSAGFAPVRFTVSPLPQQKYLEFPLQLNLQQTIIPYGSLGVPGRASKRRYFTWAWDSPSFSARNP